MATEVVFLATTAYRSWSDTDRPMQGAVHAPPFANNFANTAMVRQSVLRRDSLIALLAEQRRASMVGDELCLKAFFQALVEAREASLEVIEAVTRYV